MQKVNIIIIIIFAYINNKIFFQLFFESRPLDFNQFDLLRKNGNNNAETLAKCSVVAPNATSGNMIYAI